MNFSDIKSAMQRLRDRNIPAGVLESFELAFDIEYTHHSTAMEGNTLSLVETKALIEDGISVGGKRLREIYEVTNHAKAFKLAKAKIAEGAPLDEKLIKDFHEILMENIIQGGIYRNHGQHRTKIVRGLRGQIFRQIVQIERRRAGARQAKVVQYGGKDASKARTKSKRWSLCGVAHKVRITGASHRPPPPTEMYAQMKAFCAGLDRQDLNAIELAAWTHAEFVRIHPFADGNGRTSRLIMNYQLMRAGFLPVNIRTEDRIRYYDSLDVYAATADLSQFAELVAQLEMQRIEEYMGIVF